MSNKPIIEAGQTLKSRSVCDHECIFSVDILDRKKSFATVKAMNKIRRVKIHIDSEGREFIFALGRYSMAPVFRAVKNGQK